MYRIKGKGCFVRELADQKRSRIYSFTEAVRNEGKLPGKKQLSLEKKEADAYLADKMCIRDRSMPGVEVTVPRFFMR